MVISSADLDFDVIVIGAGISGMYQLYRLRKLGLRVRVLERGTGVGERGIGIGIRARDSIRKVTLTDIPFRRNCSTSGTGPNALPHSLKFCDTCNT